jgi:hypothetical protein
MDDDGGNNGKDERGRFSPGHGFAKGRPRGSKNKPINPPTALTRRRFHTLKSGVYSDLGGYDGLSTGEIQLAKRVAYISMRCELMERETRLENIDLALYGTLTSHLCKALKMIGLKRVPHDVTPSLRGYLEAVSEPETPSDEAPSLACLQQYQQVSRLARR